MFQATGAIPLPLWAETICRRVDNKRPVPYGKKINLFVELPTTLLPGYIHVNVLYNVIYSALQKEFQYLSIFPS